jgi:hypothetical protein
MTGLSSGTKYYFKAFATNSVGTSYGSILDFTTQVAATATATGPTGNTNDANVTLTYSSTGSPTSVKLYYTKDGGTNWTLAGTDSSVDGSYAYTITSGDGTYGWIAVAIGGGSTETDPPAGGTTPEAASLILDATAPPAPSLVSPANGDNILDNTPTFEWTSVTDPSGVTYQIQIDDNADFSSPNENRAVTDNTYTIADENALGMFIPYFWHVRAVDGMGNPGDWSEERNFTVVPIGAIGVLLMPLLMLLPFALMLRRQNRRYP